MNFRISDTGIITSERATAIRNCAAFKVVRPKTAPAGVSVKKQSINTITRLESNIKSLRLNLVLKIVPVLLILKECNT